MEYMQCQEICKILKLRERESHKGTYGAAELFAGSEGMMGAALLSARACMRSGLGLLTVHTAGCGYTVLQLGIPEAKCERDASDSHISQILVPEGIHAVGIGPGIGKHPATAEALHEFLLSSPQAKLILDADALNILSENPDWLRLLPERTVITPHPGEWKRLEAAINSLTDKTKLPRLIIVFKGAYTRVADFDLKTGKVSREWTNTAHGHSGMAVGGSGDTLTGIILSLLAQNYEPYDAARLGVFVHSFAADLALIEAPAAIGNADFQRNSGKQSEESWLPSDLIENLGRAFSMIKVEQANS